MAHEDAAKYQSMRPPVQQANKAEKMSAPVSEEQRKQNFELFSKLGIPSIAALKQKEQQLNESEASQKATLQRNNPFDAPTFSKAWETVCASVKEKEKDSLLVSLTRHPHEVDYATFNIKITIDNKVQEQDLNREKPWILEMLRDILENDQVNFEIVLTENTVSKQLYTQKDKFMKLAEKNPALIYLAEKLKLEL